MLMLTVFLYPISSHGAVQLETSFDSGAGRGHVHSSIGGYPNWLLEAVVKSVHCCIAPRVSMGGSVRIGPNHFAG